MSEPAAGPQDSAASYHDLLETSNADSFGFSEKEQRMLDLFDQEAELRLERSLLEASLSRPAPIDAAETDASLDAAERELLQARAVYRIRNKVIQHALMADPVLKAVHGASNSSLGPQRILPLVEERDVVAMVHSDLAARLVAATTALSTAEQLNLRANERNRRLAQALLSLADGPGTQDGEEAQDPEVGSQLHGVERGLRRSRREWRTVKSLLAGVIVGSGVDWAGDARLRELVMDDEDDAEH